MAPTPGPSPVARKRQERGEAAPPLSRKFRFTGEGRGEGQTRLYCAFGNSAFFITHSSHEDDG
jgi:hypothetical protein